MPPHFRLLRAHLAHCTREKRDEEVDAQDRHGHLAEGVGGALAADGERLAEAREEDVQAHKHADGRVDLRDAGAPGAQGRGEKGWRPSAHPRHPALTAFQSQ